MIVNPSHKRLLIHPPPKWSLPDSIDLFDVSHDNLSSHIPKHFIPEREVLLIEDKSASSKYFCQHQFLFTPSQPCINRMRYHTWAYNDSSLATLAQKILLSICLTKIELPKVENTWYYQLHVRTSK